jgi:branched-chain amino acid transport system ATP-binding protein
MSAVLELDGVSAAYGPYRALFDVSVAVEPGEAVALVGSNGAGKTTVARVASGILKPTRGSITVDGVALTGARTYKFAQAGVAHAPEGHSIFATLSVQDNLTLSFRRVFGRGGVRANLERAYELFPILGERRTQIAGTLSGGQQRMLSMARVMVEKPKVLIADELSLGLAPVVVDELYASLERLREEGTALLVVEQQVDHALTLCSRVLVLDHGRVTWQGDSADARNVVSVSFA